ncbi:alpha/beta fold hydrolase [Fictibacillus nanhaiensis]|uniref:alpha/beta fold hydrolase n=1 Tax=Fictibacillus nanhaiensis TaxID=742169 RepID=UPI003C298B59
MRVEKKLKFWRVVRNLLLVLVSILIGWFVLHQSLTVYEQRTYPAIGERVEVDDKRMHVYTKGKGENTILLLTGLGTAAPVLDFMPMIDELAKSNKVVVVEPFGYGWSDITDKERTVENIVEELRTALKKSHIKGPYILMPHSVSGIYSMYYANRYPEEIKAVIGIDFTLPQALGYFNEPAPKMPEYLSFVAPTGIARLATYIAPESILPISKKGTYSTNNLKKTKMITSWKGYNKNVVNETNEIDKNIRKTKEMKFPSKLPVMVFVKKIEKPKENGKSTITFFQDQLRDVLKNEIIPLEGHHYLHWTNYSEMNHYINKFIKENK